MEHARGARLFMDDPSTLKESALTNRRHLARVLLVGAIVLTALSALGIPVGQVVPYALFLAWPLVMMFMMRSMNHKAHMERQHNDQATVTSMIDLDDRRHPLDQTTITATDEHLRDVDQQYRR
jgi:hypothetical protein